MKTLILCYFLLQAAICTGQNVKLEISDYSRRIDGKEYATFQFANSSYSYSRATLVFITDRAVLLELVMKIPGLFSIKQEYTDVWVLGITDLDQANITATDEKIISNFFSGIIKYRSDNGLPAYTLQQLHERKVFLNKKEDVCKYISCRSRPGL